VFALQYIGQCFLGSMADVATMNAASQNVPDSMCYNVPCVIPGATCYGGKNKVFALQGVPLFPSKAWFKVEHQCRRERQAPRHFFYDIDS
jgi:hypothetical protein